MGQTIGDVLPLAVGVAASPIPIIAVILMLFSGRARANSLAFLFGWVVGIVIVCAFFVWLAGTQDLSTGGQPSTLASSIKFLLGVLLLLAGVKQWRSRPEPGADVKMPGWMQRIDSLKPGAALGLGFLLSAVNPKNLLLIVGAAVTIAQSSLSTTDDAITIAVFTVIGSFTVALPTLAYLVLGERAQPSLDRAKSWLSVNNTAVMAVLFLVFGFTLLGKGLGGLV
jgi:threonine/homoserine/homoserine lactone efflux protein